MPTALSRLDPGVWRRLIHFGISRVKPTRRGTRGGRRRSCTTTSTTFLHRTNNFCATPSLESTFCSPTVGNLPERRVLHIPPPSQLNIQLDTFPIGSINNQPVTAIGSQNRHRTLSKAPRGRNPSNISVINCRPRREEHEFGMNILLANTQSLAPKIDEVRSVMLNVKPDLGFFTETWLRETISDSQVNIPGYSFIARNRCVDIHGGVGLYIHDSIKFKPLDEFSDPDFESLWVWLRPRRLPRGFPCLVAGTIYHPQLGVNNSGMLNHLTTTLTDIVGQYPGCGIFVCGDFNRLSLSRLTSQFKLKQIIDKPTRGDKILDLVLTNLSHTYDENAVYTLPPFGLSDHNVVIVRTKKRPSRAGPSRKLISRRDTRASRKAELGRFFSAVDWSILDSAPNIDDRSRQPHPRRLSLRTILPTSSTRR